MTPFLDLFSEYLHLFSSFFFFFFFRPIPHKYRTQNRLTLWQLRRFLAVWKDLNDAPELYDARTMDMDTTKKLLSGHYEPRVIGKKF